MRAEILYRKVCPVWCYVNGINRDFWIGRPHEGRSEDHRPWSDMSRTGDPRLL